MISAQGSLVSGCNGCDQFEENGFHIAPDVISPEECDALSAEFTALFHQQQAASRRTMGGLRNVLQSSALAAQFALDPRIVSLAGALIGSAAFPVKATFFDKTSGANWSVPWHQDLAIAVAQRVETSGFGPWSVKDGIVHVQPPTHILEGVAAVRLHLDDCLADNGALRIIPGSHMQGELDTDAISRWTMQTSAVICQVAKGSVLIMRPLLLHASTAARCPSHRRVLHVEYATADLPNGLKWFEHS